MNQDAFWQIAAAAISGLLIAAIVSLITNIVKKKRNTLKTPLTLSLFTACLVVFVLSLLLNQVLYRSPNDDKDALTVAAAATAESSSASLISNQTSMAPSATLTQVQAEPTATIIPTQEPDKQASELLIKVTDPQNGDHVQDTAKVSGTVEGDIPDDTFLWVVVNPDTSTKQYWPQEKAIEADENGIWRCTAVFGEDNSSNHTFYIHVVSVNAKDNQYYIDYLNDCRESGSYPGLSLPPSAATLCKIAVVRD